MLRPTFNVCHASSAATLAILLSVGVNAAHAQRQCTPWMEGCAPRRPYGYYETTWRQWPGQRPTPAAPSQAEQVPTPAPVEPAREQPRREPETTTPREPARTEPAPTGPSTEPPSSLFEDMPTESAPTTTPAQPMPAMPSTPSEPAIPAPAEPSPLEGLPTLPPPSTAPSGDDTPPKMPDDDPFKDDPPELPKSSSDVEPRHEREALGALDKGSTREHAVAARWKLTPKTSAPVEHAVEPDVAPAVAEPKLLPAAGQGETPREPAALKRPAGRNVLRESTASESDRQVVSAAHWTTGEAASVTKAAPRRLSNPLRDR